jgi:ATPase family associated with various cellular activities (AAA)
MKQSQTRRSLSLRQLLELLDRDHSERRVGLAVLVVSLVYGLSGLPGFILGLVSGVVLLLYFYTWLSNALHFIDARIKAILGETRGWGVHTKYYPLYKFVDIHRAAQTFAAQQPRSVQLLSEHRFALSAILHGLAKTAGRTLNTPTYVARNSGYAEEIHLPSDSFWLIRTQAGAPFGAGVIRVWLPARNGFVHLEVATQRPNDAQRILDAIAELASTHSIYRNRMIRMVFGPEVRGDYGEDESMEPMDLIFYKEQPIGDRDIILDEMHRELIERTIIDFHQRRDQLRQLGLPGKRGVLFYGPPGTGKTYTCKYIAHRLATATTIVVTGHALLHMKAICAIAKMLQPALVLLEDVDLVFAQRDNNAYNTVLGEFIDQLDGFGDADQIIFILTTNAIERIESAIKDRPGRVSQCVYFGPPSATLRQRYLDVLVQPYDTTSVDLSRLVGQTEGVSQAFLKELVFRAVQIASDQLEHNGAALRLDDEHFATALREMTTGSGRVAQRIIGFRMDADR